MKDKFYTPSVFFVDYGTLFVGENPLFIENIKRFKINKVSLRTAKNIYMKKILIFVFASFLGGTLFAQMPSVMQLSLAEAQDYAVANNLTVQSARYDIESSRLAVWETISSALPSLAATGSITDNLKLTTTLLPGEMMGMPGEKIPVSFGSKYNSSGSLQASMVLFNAPLIVAIQTTKLAQQLSQKNLLKSELDIKESVASTYFLILISERSLEIVDDNLEDLRKTLLSTQAMVDVGMAQSTDVDQLSTNIVAVEASRASMLTTIEINFNMLRFLLGVDLNTQIELTQSIDDIMAQIDVDLLQRTAFDYTTHIDYQLLSDQEKMSELSLKSAKAAVLPTLSGFYNVGTNGMGDKLNNLKWFDNSMLGAQLSVPIFASGQRYTKIKEAKVALDKVRNSKQLVTDQLLMQEKQLRFNLETANVQYEAQKFNIEVAKRVYQNTNNKYEQGMASSLELTQANMQYMTAESNYIQSLMSLFTAKVALDKLMNNL